MPLPARLRSFLGTLRALRTLRPFGALRALRRSSSLGAEMEEEFRFHLERRAEDLIRSGVPPAEARRRAQLEFGSTERWREEGREARGLRLFDTLGNDLRFALRSLRRTPGFTVMVVAILALGIGMATSTFTVFETVLVDRLPVRAQDRVVIMHPLDRSDRHLDVPDSYRAQIERDSALFSGVAGVYHLVAPQPFMDGSAVVVLTVAGASTNYFDVLGMRPALGRFFRPADGQPGAPPVLVLSHAAWRRDFGGDPTVVGRSLVMSYTQQRARIIGVAPAGFDYPGDVDVWRALPPAAAFAQVDIIARLAPHATLPAARAGLLALTRRANPFAGVPPAIRAGSPAAFQISGVAARSFADTVLGGSRAPLVALTLAVGLLLLIACVNIGTLSLVRLLGRTREIAVRRALGAGSGDVVRLFAMENALLGAIGGGLGFLTAVVALRIVRAAAPPQLPRIDALGPLGVPLAAAVAITLLALLAFEVLPSLIASRIRSYVVLRSDARSGTESRSARCGRQGLVAMQIALAVVLLAGAGLLVRTVARLESMDLGYRADHLSIVSFTAPQGALPAGDSARGEVAKQLLDRIEATPGVVAATPILSQPFQGQSLYIMKLARAEQPVTERGQNPFVPFEFVGPDYFRTLAIPILRGRGFTASDTRGSERVVVVNQTLARQLWPAGDALGKRLVSVNGMTRDTPFTVVGVASDTRFRELRAVEPVVYFEWDQVQNGFPGDVALRTTRPLAAMLPALRAASRDVDPALVLWQAHTMDQLLAAPLAQPRLSALLLAGFSLAALLLSAIGLYGVMASGVRRQTHDIGVRMALGATPRHVRRLVLGQALSVVAIGVAVGLTAAVTGSRLLRSLLYRVSPTDPLTLAAVTALLLAVAVVAAYVPARRATRVDPMEALRAE
jgi:putative ABC transport system permease protein